MEQFKNNNKGFTLIEMLIAMSIFVIFTGILINSYSSIVASQNDANEYRDLYAEARHVMDKLTEELRGGVVYYPLNKEGIVNNQFKSGVDRLTLLSKDGERSVCFAHKDSTVRFSERDSTEQKSYALTSEKVAVKELNLYVSPAADPYHAANIFADSLQFQPKVTVEAVFERDRGVEDPYVVTFKTTVSSRVYQSIVLNDDSLIVNCDG